MRNYTIHGRVNPSVVIHQEPEVRDDGIILQQHLRATNEWLVSLIVGAIAEHPICIVTQDITRRNTAKNSHDQVAAGVCARAAPQSYTCTPHALQVSEMITLSNRVACRPGIWLAGYAKVFQIKRVTSGNRNAVAPCMQISSVIDEIEPAPNCHVFIGY
jgi:hypothetical protein